jgi:glycosyltransferase involved in cell wall biosynthesis
MRRLGARRAVTVHEVYDENPFVAPMPGQKGPLGALKRAKYRLTHRLEQLEDSLARQDFLAEAVIVHTRDAAEILMRKGCAEGKIHVLPMPVISASNGDREKGLGRWSPDRRPVVLVFGFLTPVNDYETVFRALTALGGRARLVVAGGVRRREDRVLEKTLDQAILRHGLSDTAMRAGFVAESDLPDLFAAADVFVCPARVKTASTSLARALGAGVPVVAPAMSYIEEINRESACIKLFEPGDATGLARCIEELLAPGAGERLRRQMAPYARKYTMAWFAEQHRQIYRRVLANHH